MNFVCGKNVDGSITIIYDNDGKFIIYQHYYERVRNIQKRGAHEKKNARKSNLSKLNRNGENGYVNYFQCEKNGGSVMKI